MHDLILKLLEPSLCDRGELVAFTRHQTENLHCCSEDTYKETLHGIVQGGNCEVIFIVKVI